jgi:FAD/FMN-containing dehydrogenase
MQNTDIARSHKMAPLDPGYQAVLGRRFNKRFTPSPDYIQPAGSADEVVAAVQETVRAGLRLAVTSGGHCLEGFVSDPEVRVIIDLSPMRRVGYDPEMQAIVVEAGATVGQTFQTLFQNWGTVLPLGEYPGIGMGGHVPGGAFGFLCRQLGLTADYLYGVEVVTVDHQGDARLVIATREPTDPHHDLWWAHTGGGAGNFGVATRFWFRSPGATGSDPAGLLPQAPASVATFKAEWRWSELDRPAFQRLLRNHGEWSERNSRADSPYATLWTLLEVHRAEFGKVVVRGVSTDKDPVRQWEDQLAALSDGLRRPDGHEADRMPWLEFALNPLPELFAMPPGGASVKVKDALLKQRLNDRQTAVAYQHLTRGDCHVMGGMLGLASYGGRINTVAPAATAAAQRSSILDMACTTGWLDPREEAENLSWVRAFYQDLFAESGGVPAPGPAYEGTFINHPDTDLADPAWNRSGVAWHALYYQANYPRLQRIKAQWDPRNVFHHALSIQADESQLEAP